MAKNILVAKGSGFVVQLGSEHRRAVADERAQARIA
jgi:hypothetical protein